jgi:serine/threonine protein kinase
VKSLLEILDYIHSNGYLHRDIKPSNIMLTRQINQLTRKRCDQIKLLDFGLCGKLDPENEFEDTLLDKCGTVGYLAPELLGNRGRVIENSRNSSKSVS